MEKKLNSFILSVITVAVLSFTLLPLFLCLGKINESKQIQAKIISKASTAEIGVDADQSNCILEQTEDLGEDYIKKLIFLGESTTYGLQRYGVLPDGKTTKQVWTGASFSDGIVRCAGTLSLSPSISATKIYYPEDGSALTVSEAVKRTDPAYLVITLGLNNGAAYYSEDEFKQCYRILLNTVIEASPSVKILLQSLFPVAKTCKIAAYTPERIALCNSWICDLAKEYDIKYLDTFSVLSDENGYLFPTYDNGGDGIHLNEMGLLAVLQYIRTHAHPGEFAT